MAPIATMLQKGHSPHQKYHLTKMAPSINGISQKCHLKTYILGFLKYYQTLLIETTPTIRRKLEKQDFKTHDHGSESYNKFNNSPLKITQLSPWQITFGHSCVGCAIFVRHIFCRCRCICLF